MRMKTGMAGMDGRLGGEKKKHHHLLNDLHKKLNRHLRMLNPHPHDVMLVMALWALQTFDVAFLQTLLTVDLLEFNQVNDR